MALPTKVSRINPKDYDLATVQRYLGDATDSLLSFGNGLTARSFLGPISYYNTTYSGGFVPGYTAIVGPSGVASGEFSWMAPAAGSLRGLCLTNYGSTVTTTYMAVYKNGAILYGSNVLNNRDNVGIDNSLALGRYPFDAADVLTVQFNMAATGNFALQGYLALHTDVS